MTAIASRAAWASAIRTKGGVAQAYLPRFVDSRARSALAPKSPVAPVLVITPRAAVSAAAAVPTRSAGAGEIPRQRAPVHCYRPASVKASSGSSATPGTTGASVARATRN